MWTTVVSARLVSFRRHLQSTCGAKAESGGKPPVLCWLQMGGLRADQDRGESRERGGDAHCAGTEVGSATHSLLRLMFWALQMMHEVCDHPMMRVPYLALRSFVMRGWGESMQASSLCTPASFLLQDKARSEGIPAHITIDAGRTQIAPSESCSALPGEAEGCGSGELFWCFMDILRLRRDTVFLWNQGVICGLVCFPSRMDPASCLLGSLSLVEHPPLTAPAMFLCLGFSCPSIADSRTVMALLGECRVLLVQS